MRYNIFGYLIGEGFRNVFKNKKSTIASLIIMFATMFVFGIFFIVEENVNHLTKTIEQQQGMSVFIYDTATEAEQNELASKIRNMQYVNTVTFKSKEDALEEMKRMFKGKKNLLSTYERDNPFKASFVVTLTDLEKAEEVQTQIENSSEIIANVVAKSDTMETLVKVADGIKVISIVILIILILISIFIITNTIKLTVHARRKEISIMKYVGATNGFIRWPFMVEGMIIGLISVLVSLAILCPCYTAVAGRIEESLISIRVNMPLLTLQEMFVPLLIVYLVLGLGIGAIRKCYFHEKILRCIKHKAYKVCEEKVRNNYFLLKNTRREKGILSCI
ncbi:MAG: ABC transporter permease [Clostridia bacterium]|nr:ABC transporter permease [Clostridia bacterium]